MNLLLQNYPEEGNRIQFLLKRDGLIKTMDFVKQTMMLYRRAVVFQRDPCKSRSYRINFIRSYLEFKRFKQLDTETRMLLTSDIQL